MISDSRHVYGGAVALVVGGCAMLVFLSVGVGIIGADGDPANAVNLTAIYIAAVGAMLARGDARWLAVTASAMALALSGIGGYAIATGLGMPYSPPAELAGLYGFFVVLFGAAAWLFATAARRRPGPGRAFDAQAATAVAMFALGALLLVYMVVVEDEPGALPLAMVAGGLGWYAWRVLR